ncbi:MAG: HD domain-containing protein [Bacteroidetes bacterium]|nr:HD domain-containing protein [Bacteroidota bacterium]
MDFQGAKSFIVEKLRKELNPGYTYHCLGHTLDVHAAVIRLIGMEGIPEEEARLMEVAALYHDSGMLVRYLDHESASVDLATRFLPDFSFKKEEIAMISSLILVTRLPQKASSIAEQVLCDADLDYLGREDFFIHSFELQNEWNHFGIRKTDLTSWLDIQVKFLSEHDYFTKSAVLLRSRKKSENLNEIISLWQQKNQKRPSTTTSS